jgi:cell shape-determining protein MreD
MRYFTTIGIGLALVIGQTSFLPRLPFIGVFFDLLLPLVIYLAAFRPMHESLPLVLFFGFLMDSLSGGPLGFFVSAYFWLTVGVRLAATVIRAENPVLLILMLMACVLLQNGFFIAAIALLTPAPAPMQGALPRVSEQIGWVLLAGPFLAALMRWIGRKDIQRARRAEALRQSSGAA